MDKPPQKPLFVFDNHISITHIFTTIFVLFSGLLFAINTQNRVVMLEKKMEFVENRHVQDRMEYKQDMREIREMFNKITDQLNKKEDRR
jgi:hypothetical protein